MSNEDAQDEGMSLDDILAEDSHMLPDPLGALLERADATMFRSDTDSQTIGLLAAAIRQLRAELVETNALYYGAARERESAEQRARELEARAETLQSAREVQDAALMCLRNDLRECAFERDQFRALLANIADPVNMDLRGWQWADKINREIGDAAMRPTDRPADAAPRPGEGRE